MKSKYYFTTLFTIILSAIISVFAFTDADATLDRSVFGYAVGTVGAIACTILMQLVSP